MTGRAFSMMRASFSSITLVKAFNNLQSATSPQGSNFRKSGGLRTVLWDTSIAPPSDVTAGSNFVLGAHRWARGLRKRLPTCSEHIFRPLSDVTEGVYRCVPEHSGRPQLNTKLDPPRATSPHRCSQTLQF